MSSGEICGIDDDLEELARLPSAFSPSQPHHQRRVMPAVAMASRDCLKILWTGARW
jgi:hypothetical protein